MMSRSDNKQIYVRATVVSVINNTIRVAALASAPLWLLMGR